MGQIQAKYSLNGGGQWIPAKAATNTITTNLTTSIPTTGLTGLWAFDEEQGSTVDDHSGNNLIGSIISAQWITNSAPIAGSNPSAITFDAIDDYVIVAHNDQLNPSNELTIAAWVNMNDVVNDQKLVGKSQIGNGYVLSVVVGTLYAELWDTAGNRYALNTGQIPQNEWVHVAFTWKTGDDLTLYINGQQVGQTPASSLPIGSNNNPLIMGGAPWDPAVQKVDGALDEVYLYHRALGGDEIKLLANGIGARTGEHVFYWDTFASEFFGQSDNVVFRIEAYSQPAIPGAAGEYQYTNSTPFPIQRPYASATTFPFRVRGTQVQVIDEGTLSPVQDAIVYKVEDGSLGELMGSIEGSDPFRTAGDGYLGGRGALAFGDQLIALKPVEIPSEINKIISGTSKISLYHTSAPVTVNGPDLFTVEEAGTQQLVISLDNQLMLLNLSISLEWDSSNDPDYLAQLEQDIKRASEILYDLSNGQVALGEITIYQNKENWNEADIVIFANNTQRPNANLGGIVTDVMSDVNADLEEIPFAFLPGQIRMPPVWNRYGNPEGTIGEDWPRVLAHEIGHYALFMIDNYLGLDGNNQLINIDCQGSAMTDAYRQDYSEFLTAADWTGDCLRSVAEKATGRSDWETILLYYGSFLSSDQTSQTGDGPRTMPIAVTQVIFSDPEEDTSLLETPFFYLSDKDGETLAVNRGQATGYLLKPYDLSTLEDDVLVPLGSPVGPLLQARGARTGDTLCVYDYSTGILRTGCLDEIDNLDATLMLEDVASDWSPEILVTPLDETQFQVTVNQAGAGDLEIQIYPTFRPTDTVKALVQTVSTTGDSYTAIFTFPLTVFSGHVRVYEVGSSPRKETIIPFSITPKWDGNGFISWGGNQIQAWDGNGFISWGGNGFISWGGNGFISWGGNGFISWGAPVVSSDGQVTLFDTENIIGGGNRPAPAAVMQAIQDPPNLPAWFTPVGQAYRYDTDGGVDEGLVILFRYLERELPFIKEERLSIYHLPDGETEWQKLETTIDPDRNQASAAMQSTGTYALIATAELPYFTQGWNNFGYIVDETRPVTTALTSIDGKYSAIYRFDALNPDQWLLHDSAVAQNYPEFAVVVNNLEVLEFGQAYWLYATEAVQGYLTVEGATPDELRWANDGNYPPATYFGYVLDDGFAAGMAVEAKIEGMVCGETILQQIDDQLGYVIQVRADDEDGCGDVGRVVRFSSGNVEFNSLADWDNSKAHLINLSTTLQPLTSLELQGDTTLIVGETATFTASAVGPDPEYSWTFGDGTTATGASVTHVFDAAGEYTVTVLATNSVSSLTRSLTLTVLDEFDKVYLPLVIRN